MEAVFQSLNVVSQWTIPATILLIVVWAARKGVPMYESFVTGAKEGFDIAIMIIPYLVAMLFVIKVFMASGIFDDVKSGGTTALQAVGLGDYAETLDLVPLAFTRPLSGSGSRGLLIELFDVHGPDSFLGNTATLMMGSTETTFYILTIYFGAVQIKRLRHALPACLLGDLAGVIASIVLGYWLYSGN